MIYLDNAATTWPKPQSVYDAMQKVMLQMWANPGRAAHGMSIQAGRVLINARESLSQLFNITDPSRIAFCPNATFALNQALKGYLKQGDHVVTTSMEHNSVLRPLWSLKEKGIIELSIVNCSSKGELDPKQVEKELKSNTALVAMTHASNVTGTILPVAEVGQTAAQRNIKFLVDASQTAGVLPIDVQALKADLLAFPGHKGLLGPQGTGGLYVKEGIELSPLLEGGTGGNSESLEQPQVMPDKLESGTQNTLGIAGLGAAVEYLLREGVENIRRHEFELTSYFMEGLKEIKGIQIYGPEDPHNKVGVVSFNYKGVDCGEIGYLLDEVYQIAVRTGIHCAPSAHRAIGTLESGTVRVSFSYFNTKEDLNNCLNSLHEIAADLS